MSRSLGYQRYEGEMTFRLAEKNIWGWRLSLRPGRPPPTEPLPLVAATELELLTGDPLR